MKKGIVLEWDEEFVTVLTPEGEFVQLKKEREYEIGEEIEARPVHSSFPFRRRSFRYALVSAVIAAALLVATWIQRPADTVYAYMSIDINPSIEAGVDDELRVLTLKAYNEEGSDVLAALSAWKSEPFSTVAKQIIALSEQKGYLRAGGEVLITTVETERDLSSERKLSAELAEIRQAVADEQIVVTTKQSTMEVRNRAVKRGMTTGKLLQIEKKGKPVPPSPSHSPNGKEKEGKKGNEPSPSSTKPPASTKKHHDEPKQPKGQKNEQQPPHQRKNADPPSKPSPADKMSPKGKNNENARPLRPGGHDENKRAGEGKGNPTRGSLAPNETDRKTKATDGNTKKAE
ncbi:anti-sigma factor domain-containing protein [Geobacillus sp. FSL W8-0032]|uniref:Anti-sigma-I factor RsgI n=1 Tax=Geobacillus icigianus TaxID=1430331 RepID=A0ABU6BBQ8_9BACL|nr:MULTISPECIES: anti-sigma factor domain-containing protein [Geobacillus]KYD26421.1 hypothetical protein B4113_1002 [Geobacillus sp. B4113_201601]MEB3749301.1 Anti-sigma-I factor RsgI [Geobacillus icigianus]